MSPKQRKRGDYKLTTDFTTIPNRLYDEWIPRLNAANFRGHGDVLGVIARQTIGWGDERTAIGTPSLAALTGFSKQRVCEILDEIEAMGAIVRERLGKGKTTELGIVVGWQPDDDALARGLRARDLRLEKKAKHAKKASRKDADERANVSTQPTRLEDERVNSSDQVTCQLIQTGNVSTQPDRLKNGDRPETPGNTRAPGDDAERLKKRKERKETDSENQSISLLGESESGAESTDRLTSGDEDCSSPDDWRTAKDWREIDALVEEKLGSGVSDAAHELGERVGGMVGGSTGIPRRKLDALAGVVGSGGAAALVEAARRYAAQRSVRHPWPYLLRTLLSAAEELGGEAQAPVVPAAQEETSRGANDDPGLRGDLEVSLGSALPRMFSAARLWRDDQRRKTVVARDGANRRDIEKAWGAELRAGGWRLACASEGSGEKKGEVA